MRTRTPFDRPARAEACEWDRRLPHHARRRTPSSRLRARASPLPPATRSPRSHAEGRCRRPASAVTAREIWTDSRRCASTLERARSAWALDPSASARASSRAPNRRACSSARAPSAARSVMSARSLRSSTRARSNPRAIAPSGPASAASGTAERELGPVRSSKTGTPARLTRATKVSSSIETTFSVERPRIGSVAAGDVDRSSVGCDHAELHVDCLEGSTRTSDDGCDQAALAFGLEHRVRQVAECLRPLGFGLQPPAGILEHLLTTASQRDRDLHEPGQQEARQRGERSEPRCSGLPARTPTASTSCLRSPAAW